MVLQYCVTSSSFSVSYILTAFAPHLSKTYSVTPPWCDCQRRCEKRTIKETMYVCLYNYIYTYCIQIIFTLEVQDQTKHIKEQSLG